MAPRVLWICRCDRKFDNLGCREPVQIFCRPTPACGTPVKELRLPPLSPQSFARGICERTARKRPSSTKGDFRYAVCCDDGLANIYKSLSTISGAVQEQRGGAGIETSDCPSLSAEIERALIAHDVPFAAVEHSRESNRWERGGVSHFPP
jgi:hypothetical protein